MRPFLGSILLITSAGLASAADKRPMTVDDLLAVKGVSDPQVSPDGKWVAYVVSEINRETNKSNSDLWLVPVSGGKSRRLTTAPGSDNHPRWSPDGRTLCFASDRGGSSQIWLLPLDGGEAHQLTKLPIDIGGPIWSPMGDKIAFAAEVFPGKTPEETAKQDAEKGKSKVRVYDKLMIRHWSAWDEGKKSHIFVCDARTGAAKDLTPKLEVNTPPAPFGGSEEYAWSPDGKEIAFTAEPIKDHAISTNTDIWIVPVDGGEPTNVTKSNLGADAQPAFSPDGKALAYLNQTRAGFEADQWVLNLKILSSGYVDKFDEAHSIQSYHFVDTPGTHPERVEGSIVSIVDREGSTSPVFRSYSLDQNIGKIPTTGEDSSHRPKFKGSCSAIQKAAGDAAVILRSSADHPAELFLGRPHSAADPLVALTHHNDALLSSLDLSPAESFTFKGADGDPVSGFLVKPPGFDPKKKYPVLFAIHGGPQGAWHDDWSARWNYQMFASPGYAVVAINPRGSTGYGQKFTDQISKDWSGKVYEDLMKGLDFALEKYEFLDKSKMAAAGGSFGGYMVNWIAGHSDRFQALISHAGVFDLTSMYGTTEELWFPDWEYGGPPWSSDEVVRRRYLDQSPSSFVANFKTPTLVIHGALDFRVPDGQGFGMFTALQRQNVPSKLVFFPDEGHWILKPQNRVEWWKEMHGWLAKYLK